MSFGTEASPLPSNRTARRLSKALLSSRELRKIVEGRPTNTVVTPSVGAGLRFFVRYNTESVWSRIIRVWPVSDTANLPRRFCPTNGVPENVIDGVPLATWDWTVWADTICV